MKELIESYRLILKSLEGQAHLHETDIQKASVGGKKAILISIIHDLESLQSKGKTSAEEFLRDKYKLVDFHDLTLNGKPWVELMEEYAQSHANKDGWVSVEDDLPDIGQSIWFYSDGGINAGYLNIEGIFLKMGSSIILPNVTHWQPISIPTPPQI